jgi:hypothetical protein
MDTPPKHSKSITWRTNRLLSLTDKILRSNGSRPRPTRTSQIHSARRQTTLRSGNLQIIEDINATNTAGPIILGLPSTILQETGPAASAPHTRTNVLDYVCMSSASKIMCYALSVAGVTDALSGYSRRCFKRHACVPDTFLYIPIQCVYIGRPPHRARSLSPLFSMVINAKAQQAQYATMFRLRPSSPLSRRTAWCRRGS